MRVLGYPKKLIRIKLKYLKKINGSSNFESNRLYA